MKVSIENDPLSAYAHAVTAMVIARSGIEDGLSTALKAVEFQSEAFLPWHMLGNCYHWSGNFKKATDAYSRALEVSGRHAWTLAALLVNFVEAKQTKEAERIYYELLLRSKTGHVLPSLLATASAAMGKVDDAMRYCQEAYETHDAYLVMGFNNWPDNKYLKAIPAYGEFFKRFGL